MMPTGILIGTVRTSAGAPVDEANVLIVDGPDHPDIAAITDAHGRFELGPLRRGVYRLQVYALGQAATEQQVQVHAHERTRVDFRLGAEDDDTVDEEPGQSLPYG